MRMKQFVASIVAFLFLGGLWSPAGTPLARFASDVCPASHTKLDAAMHSQIHAAPGSNVSRPLLAFALARSIPC
jgi:hypothetical protein